MFPVEFMSHRTSIQVSARDAKEGGRNLLEATNFRSKIIFHSYLLFDGYAVAQLVEVLRYKPEGRGFDSRCCHWNFSLT